MVFCHELLHVLFCNTNWKKKLKNNKLKLKKWYADKKSKINIFCT